MKSKSQIAYLGTDQPTWKLFLASGLKPGTSFSSDFFNAMVAASGKTNPIIGLVEFNSELGLSVSIRTDTWGRNSQYTVQDKTYRPISLKPLTEEEAKIQFKEIKDKGHDFYWLLAKLQF